MTDYVELHAHSCYSLLDGAAFPEDLAARAAALGMGALALTDHDAVYGAPRFVAAAQAQGVRPLLGAELTLEGGHHLTLLVEDEVGWGHLCTLISLGRANAPKGESLTPWEALAGRTGGLIALSGCRKGVVAALLLRGDREGALAAAGRYRDLFGCNNYWIELQRQLLPDDERLTGDLAEIATQLGLGCAVSNDAHYAARDGHRLQDVLVCIRHLTTLDASARLRRPNSEWYLKSAAEMAALFPDHPEALRNTIEIAERCRFQLRCGLQDLPRFPTPGDVPTEAYLRQLAEEGLRRRWGEPSARALAQLERELAVIAQGGLSNYFLIVWDLVRHAREQGILCQGRGSAANSLVAYLLGITPIDPLAHDLVFERFLSAERAAAPDIDIDFQADRREEVIQYAYRRYGTAHAAMACTLITFQARSARRDVGKALGLSPEAVQQALAVEEAGDNPALAQLLELCDQLDGYPRHLGIHNGGMIITGPPLAQRVPTEPATMPERWVVQWDKEALEEAGLVKIDLLGLRMLSAIAEAVETIAQLTDRRPDLDRLPFDDPAVYRMIARADTIGVFQVESRAQAQVLPQLKPVCFNDLVVSISLIRPGPLQGQMVHPYLRRRRGEEAVSCFHPLLEPALSETLGVILFQEQVLKVARDLAGFTAGQGEQLRRALGGKEAAARIARFRDAFIAGAVNKGVDPALAEEVFAKLRAFGGYSFPKSHAAAFAVLVYRSAWLKLYHPAPFAAALLNHQPMGYWSPAVLVNDAKRHGLGVWPLDIRRSAGKCTVEHGGIRLGLEYVNGLGEEGSARITEARGERPFADLADFCRRTRLPRRLVEELILAGGMDGWGRERRPLLWELGKLRYREEELDLPLPDEGVALPPLSRAEALGAEYGILGLSTGEHVMALYRPWLRERGMLSSAELGACPVGRRARVAGLVVVHQAPPTAKGHQFLTLEDEWGLINVIVRPDVVERYARELRGGPILWAEGVVQRRDGVTNLVAERAGAVNEHVL